MERSIQRCPVVSLDRNYPALSQGAADACLEAIKIANEMGVTVSTDLNYRKNLWKYGKIASEVMPALVEGCDIILGNEEDAEKVFEIKPEGFDVALTGGKLMQPNLNRYVPR